MSFSSPNRPPLRSNHIFNPVPLAWTPFLLAMVLLFLFLFTLSWRPLSMPDEGRYPEIAREMLNTGDFITPRVNGALFLDKPPLYYWLQAASYQMFGVSSWSIRFFPALTGAGFCLGVYYFARRFYDSRMAWLSAALMATNPLFFGASQYSNMDLEVAVWISASVLSFVTAVGEGLLPTARRWFLFAYLFAALAILTKGLIGLLLPATILFLWLLATRRLTVLRRCHMLKGFVLIVLICLPWFVAVQRANPTFFHYFFIYQQFERFTATGFNNIMPIWFYVPIALLSLFPWVFLAKPNVFKTTNSKATISSQDLNALWWVWSGFVLVFFTLPESKIVGYIVPILPPLVMIAAQTVNGLFEGHRPKRLLVSLALPYIAVICGLIYFAIRTSDEWGTKLFEHLDLRIALVLLLVIMVFALFSLKNNARFIGLLLLANVFLNAIIIITAALIDHKSAAWVVQRAEQTLGRKITNADTIIGYRAYTQDLPIQLNLNKPVLIVGDWDDVNILKSDNWQREMLFALQTDPKLKSTLIDVQTFETLQSQQPIIFSEPNATTDKLIAQHNLRVLARDRAHIVLTTP